MTVRRLTRASRRALLAATVLSLGGCSALSAGSDPPTRTQAAGLAQAQRTHEYPARPQHQTALGGSMQDPVVAIEAFATAYINWTASTVSGRMAALGALSIGQARSAMALAAAQTAQDYELRRGGIANSGSVEAVAPLRGHADEYVVVTRELTTASNTTAYQELRPAWHLALATVTRVSGGGWALSSWQPEN